MMIHFDQYFSGGLKPPISNKFVYDTQITIFKWGYKPTYNLGGPSCTVYFFCHVAISEGKLGRLRWFLLGGFGVLFGWFFGGFGHIWMICFGCKLFGGLADLIWGWSWILTTKLVMDFEQQSLDDLKPGKLEISTKKMEWGISHNSGIGRKTWNNRLNHGILRITWKWDSWFNPKVNKFEFADSTGYRIVDFNSCWWILSSKNHGIWSNKFSGHPQKKVVLTPEKSRLLDDREDFTWFYLLMLSYFATNFCACLQFREGTLGNNSGDSPWLNRPCEISSNNCDRLIKNQEAWPAWNDWIKFTWTHQKNWDKGTRTRGNSQRCSWTCQEIPQRMEKDHRFSRGKNIIGPSFPGCAHMLSGRLGLGLQLVAREMLY